MPKSISINLLVPLVVLNFSDYALAHSNHGLSDSHWHATDAWGFVVLSVLVVVAIWLSRRDK
jgi:hypothetical protein